MSKPAHPIIRAWWWGIELIVALGVFGACPFLTGTYIPFILVCFQVLVILTLIALTIVAKAWQGLQPSLKRMLLLALADQLAGRSKQRAIHWEPPIPVVPVREEQRYSQYEQPGIDYPEMLPPQE